MKRSVGVTVWAVLLIIAGLLGTVGAIVSLSMGQRSLDQLTQSVERLKTLPTGIEEGQIPPEQLAPLRVRLEGLVQQVRKATESPIVRTTTALASLLSLVALAAGIGLFFLKRWARTAAMWQAGCSVVLALFVTWFSPQRELTDATLRVYEGLIDSKAQQMMQTGQAIGQWLGLILLVAWNGLLIWYCSRPTVKAYFGSPPPEGGVPPTAGTAVSNRQ